MLTFKPKVTAEHRREAAASMKEMGADKYLKGPFRRWWATRSLARTIAEREEIEKLPYSVAMSQASACEARFDWKGAEESYLRAAGEAGDEEPGWRAHAFSNLASLCCTLDRDPDALHYAHLATALERQHGAMTLPITLHQEILIMLGARRFDDARQAIEELFAVLEKQTIHPVQTLQALLARSRYYLGIDDLTEAEANLELAWQQMEHYENEPTGAGRLNQLAAAWAIRGKLCTLRNDVGGAVAAWQKCVSKRRSQADLPHVNHMGKYENLAFSLYELGLAQRAAGDPLASESFNESGAIRQSIGLTPLDG